MQTAPPPTELSSYFHSIDGRMRIKVSEVKGSPRKAAEVEEAVGAISGVEQVSANPVTGNVLVLYDQKVTGQQQVLDAFKSINCLRAESRTDRRQNNELSNGLAKYVLQSVTEVAVERLILALV